MTAGRGVGMADCRDCGEPIKFVHLDTGGTIPVNPGASEKPGPPITAHTVGRDLRGRFLFRHERRGPFGWHHYTPHAETCEARTKPAPPPDSPLF